MNRKLKSNKLEILIFKSVIIICMSIFLCCFFTLLAFALLVLTPFILFFIELSIMMALCLFFYFYFHFKYSQLRDDTSK